MISEGGIILGKFIKLDNYETYINTDLITEINPKNLIMANGHSYELDKKTLKKVLVETDILEPYIQWHEHSFDVEYR